MANSRDRWARFLELAETPAPVSGLVAFRVLFGLMAFWSAARFELNGWVEQVFGGPRFFFHYWGFSVIEPMSVGSMHVLFGVMLVSSALITVGLAYRAATVVYFLSFTYVELSDVTNYLNHYYLQSLLAFVLCFLPLHRAGSLDARFFPSLAVSSFPRWMTWLLRAQIALVYFYAAVAKATPDWLLHGQPMLIWLHARTDTPLIGWLFELEHVPLLMGWAGFLYDLTIPAFLLHRRTRPYAYVAVIVFHTTTKLLFPIGMFPVIMTTATLIFFEPDWPTTLAARVRKLVGRSSDAATAGPTAARAPALAWSRVALVVAGVWLAIHVLVPLRTFAYGGNVLWHEQGMRWSWRVMAREKNGSVVYRVRADGWPRERRVRPSQYLTSIQEREMSAQPDLILQLAHHIRDEQLARGLTGVEVRVDALCSLNGRRMTRLIDPDVDLAAIEDGLAPATWILPAPEGPPPASEGSRRLVLSLEP
ncbi:MAG: HTTM domain-containing protein [Deltaproteobacteria bacterium]|jgi:vitamin K-dependent gamma-carboxylase